ncbi:unnamed protein product, partial [Medioppia subpectinata]
MTITRTYNTILDNTMRSKHQKVGSGPDSGVGTRDDPLKYSDEERRSGLCRLLWIHMFFGVTYCGNCPRFNNYPLKKAGLILYDCVVIVMFAAFEWFAFTDDVFTRLFYNVNNKGIINLLFRFAGLSVAVEFFAIKLMLLVNGWSLVRVIKTTGLEHISSIQSWIITVFLIVMAILNAFMLPIHFTDLDKSLSGVFSDEKLKTIGFFIVGLFFSMNKFSVTSLLLFSAFAISKQIKEWTVNLTQRTIKIQTLCENILALRTQIETINELTGVIMFIKVFLNAMFMSSAGCVSAVGKLPFAAYVGVAGFAITAMTDIIIICYASQIMINAMSALCKQVEWALIVDGVYGGAPSDDHYKQLTVILALRDSISVHIKINKIKITAYTRK